MIDRPPNGNVERMKRTQAIEVGREEKDDCKRGHHVWIFTDTGETRCDKCACLHNFTEHGPDPFAYAKDRE